MSVITATHEENLMQPSAAGKAQFWVDRHFHDLEYMHLVDRQHAFSSHTHDSFVMGCVERGHLNYHNCGRQADLLPGQVLVINPGDLHDCRPGEDGASYRMFYPSDRMMAEAAEILGARGGNPPRFAKSSLGDRDLASAIDRLHRQSQAGAGRLNLEGEMLTMLEMLFTRHGDATIANDPATGDIRLIRKACLYLEDHLDRDVSLTELAEYLAVNQFRLIREFRKVKGITPHAYLINLRLRLAKQALAQGHSLAQTALDHGFWDQSHFTRRFKCAFGITPKTYQNAYLTV